MHKFLISSLLGTLLALSMFACVRGNDEKMMQFECEKQNSGEACNKLGLKRKGQEALMYFRMGCEKQSTVSCLSLAERTPDPAEAARVLGKACEWKNTAACGKAEELAKVQAAKAAAQAASAPPATAAEGGLAPGGGNKPAPLQDQADAAARGSRSESTSDIDPDTGRRRKKGYFRKKRK